MGLPIIIGLLLVGLVAFFARGYDVDVVQGLEHLKENTVDERAAIMALGKRVMNWCERKIGGLARYMLGAGLIIVAYLWWHDDLRVGSDALICAVAAGGGILLIKRQMPHDPAPVIPLVPPAADATRRQRFMYRATQARNWGRKQWHPMHRTPFTTSVMAVLGFGITLLFVSASAKNQALAIVAMVYLVLMLPGLVIAIALLPLEAIKQGIRLSEFTSDKVFHVLSNLGGALAGIKGEKKPATRINIFNEERIIPIFFQCIFVFVGIVAMASVANVYVPGLTTIFVMSGLVSTPITVSWLVLMGAGISIQRVQVRSALIFALAVFVAAILSILKAVFPSWWIVLVDEAQNVWRSGITMLSPWEAGIGFGIGTVAIVLVLWLWRPVPSLVIMENGSSEHGLPFALYAKRFTTFSFGAVALFCGANLAFAGHYGKSANMVGADGPRLSVMHAPTVTAEDGGVRLAWKKAAGAVGYRLSWREPIEGTFHGVVGAKDLGKGVLEYLDTDMEPGSEYFYRVTALYLDGWKSEPSPEVRVYVPKAAMKPRKAESKPNTDPPKPASDPPVVAKTKPKPAKAKVKSRCAGSPCTVTGDLAAYCEKWGC